MAKEVNIEPQEKTEMLFSLREPMHKIPIRFPLISAKRENSR